jgi:hypothetical protein
MVFEVNGTKKSFIIQEFPTIGQLVDIENLKVTLAGGRYNDMVKSQVQSMTFALDLIDAISCFTILNPIGFNAVFKDLVPQGKSVMDLPANQSKMIVDQYNRKFIPWYKPLMLEIYSSLNEEKEEDFDIDKEVTEKN